MVKKLTIKIFVISLKGILSVIEKFLNTDIRVISGEVFYNFINKMITYSHSSSF